MYARIAAIVLAATSILAQVPAADHHMHVLSPAAAAFNSETPLPTVNVPDAVDALLRERAKRWNDEKTLAELYTESSLVLDPNDAMWIRGRADGAAFLSTRFARAYAITPVEFSADAKSARLAGYYTRPDGAKTRYFGHVLLALEKSGDAWRIAIEAPTFQGPWTREALTADQLIQQLDEAGIARATILGVAYWFHGDYAKARAENDWMAAEVAKHATRLVGFCGIDPLQDWAIEEVTRCAAMPMIRGIKMQLGNSHVDYANAAHIEKLQRVFRAANEHKLAIVVHLWTDQHFGRAGAQAFFDRVLPMAPDVTVQIAHLAGGGPGWSDEALGVFADAIAAGDARMKHVYFDVATVADEQTPARLRLLAERIRQIGVARVLYGTDSAPPNPPARIGWDHFRTSVPLTDAEIKTIAANVAPYFVK